MMIQMGREASAAEIDYVVRRVQSLGLQTHVSQDGPHTIIGVLGDLRAVDPAALIGLRGVERVITGSGSFRLASRDFKDSSAVDVAGCSIGRPGVVVIAGPCAVESRTQLLETAWAVKEAGAHMLRGGAFKPRTSPYSFQGLGEQGLELLAEARAETGLPIVTEVMAPEHLEMVVHYADLLQIGTRNMQNYPLLRAVGESDKPVLLKRGMMSTIEEFLLSAEYVLSQGNPNVVLCERGIRTFETATRNSLDINAVPLLGELTHLPLIVDPSHATGRSSLVRAVSLAAVAAGADGLLIEVHPDPERALSDGPQSLDLDEFSRLMKELAPISEAVGREISRPESRTPASVETR